MLSLLIGTVVLSLLHALIPNHWLPLVLLARADKWTHVQTAGYTIMVSLAHIFSTVLIGLVIGVVGMSLAAHLEIFSTLLVPAILIGMGVVYFLRSHHAHAHDSPPTSMLGNKKRYMGMLVVGMFLSPCLEIETIYLSGGAFGFGFLLLVSATYLVISLAGICCMTWLALAGLSKVNSPWIENNEKKITGVVLIALGVATHLMNL